MCDCYFYDKKEGTCRSIGHNCKCLYEGDSDICREENKDEPVMCEHYDYKNQRCLGTKEMDVCNCQGNKGRCDFYSSIRANALREDIPKDAGNWYILITEVRVEDFYERVDIVTYTNSLADEEFLSRVHKSLQRRYRNIESSRIVDIIPLEKDQNYVTQIVSHSRPMKSVPLS